MVNVSTKDAGIVISVQVPAASTYEMHIGILQLNTGATAKLNPNPTKKESIAAMKTAFFLPILSV